jgi:hypothetical protein
LFLLIYLISAVLAAGASMTTCRIWEGVPGGPDIELAFDSGATSCLAEEGLARVDAQFYDDTGYLFDARVQGRHVWSDLQPRGRASLEGDVSELLTFYGLPAGSTFILEWILNVARLDANATIELVGTPINSFAIFSRGTMLLPIINDSVGISASISAETGFGVGVWQLSLAADSDPTRFSRVVDADGNPLKGFTFSVASDRNVDIQDGTQVQSIPEPGTALLFVVPLLWLARRSRAGGGRPSRILSE